MEGVNDMYIPQNTDSLTSVPEIDMVESDNVDPYSNLTKSIEKVLEAVSISPLESQRSMGKLLVRGKPLI